MCKSPEVTLRFYPTTKTLKIQRTKQVYYRSLLQDIGGLDINNFKKQETNPEALERDEEESFDASLVFISSQQAWVKCLRSSAVLVLRNELMSEMKSANVRN